MIASPRLWIAGGVALLVALLAAGLWIQTERLAARTAELDACHQRVEILGAHVRQQNAAVEGWQKAGAAAAKRAQVALAAVETERKASDARVASLRAAVASATPKPTPENPTAGTCIHALQIVREDLGAGKGGKP